jgi:hypothetical protein
MKPVPTLELASELNGYDLALVVIPPVTVNEDQAVPNKLLESIQGRLGLIVGPNSAMSKIVLDHNIGLVLKGWRSADIVSGLNSISADEIAKYKRYSGAASEEFSTNIDKKVFLGLLEKLT